MEPTPHVVVSPFRVRSYEADSYSHLNNGVYASWCEQGRLDHLQSLGFSYDGFAAREQWMVVARTELDFRTPLHVGDAVELTTRVERLGRTSCRFRQVMRRAPGTEGAGEVACEALTVMVFTGPSGPIPVPEDFRRAIEGATPAP